MTKGARLLVMIPGFVLLLFGLGILGLVYLLSTAPGYTTRVGSFGIPTATWGVILLLIGIVLILGGARLGTPS